MLGLYWGIRFLGRRFGKQPANSEKLANAGCHITLIDEDMAPDMCEWATHSTYSGGLVRRLLRDAPHHFQSNLPSAMGWAAGETSRRERSRLLPGDDAPCVRTRSAIRLVIRDIPEYTRAITWRMASYGTIHARETTYPVDFPNMPGLGLLPN